MGPHSVDVLVVGGGPAGMVAACLLAREGYRTLVIERNPNFDREFRGEILQPRFHRALRDVGLYDHVAACPHEEIRQAHFYFKGKRVGGFNLERLDRAAGTTWWMTQPTLLQGLREYGARLGAFELWFGATLRGLEGTTATVEVVGESCEVRARVVIGADGRYSTVRTLANAGLLYEETDLDVIWFVLPRPPEYEHVFSFFMTPRHNYLILPRHPNQLQCGIVVQPGEFIEMRRDLNAMRDELRRAHPVFRDFADGLRDWSAFRPLKGTIALAREWARDGLVLIGDAAHTCSPAGGIGVAVAIETAIVAADVVAEGLSRNDVSAQHLGQVQARRAAQVRTVHAIQRRIGRNFVRSPGWARYAVPILVRLASLSGLVPVIARQLLTQREPLRTTLRDTP